jgi:hypothetical protein
VALGRLALAWIIVWAWLVAWWLGERRLGPGSARKPIRRGQMWVPAGEALLLTLFAALWFGSLGAGTWWLPFLLVGLLVEWPVGSARGAARVGRILVAGGLLAWRLGA